MVNHIWPTLFVKGLKSFKSSNKEKMLLKLVVQSCLTALRAAPEQMSIPFDKLPDKMLNVAQRVSPK